MALDADLQEKKNQLSEFVEITKNVLNYLPAVLTSNSDKGDYRIHVNEQAGFKKYIRPINTRLFISDSASFDASFSAFSSLVVRIKNGERTFNDDELLIIDRTLYTIQQSIGAGLDLLVNPNSARKHVGNRFEELIKVVFTEIGISNKKKVLKIPYETDEGTKVYKCENDLILSPFEKVKSTSKSLDKNEIVVSVKTTSKDRMGKMFIDKILLERFVEHDQKVIGIFLNDVQRKEHDNISYTLVSNLFMVYSKFLTELEGVYYLDPPPNAKKEPYNKYMKSFSELITTDVWRLLSS
ncbi:MAG TPA: hypothetical protein DDY13_15680 [Cytophagales bacterium]|jgi:hypothetical protein|nr:hypothetical protein [Cytophagales bacterium]